MDPAPEIRYKRLTRGSGRGGSFVAFRSRSSLWLGPEHLLAVDSNGYTENYKRFYFRDIQAFIVRKTRAFLVLNIIVGILALGSLILTLAILPKTARNWDDDGPAFFIFGVITGLFLLVLVLNFIRGPTCKTFLRTAVQIEQLPSLNRVRKTRKVLKKIHPLIVAAQGGELTAESVSAQLREWNESPSGQASTATVEEDPNAPPRLGV